MVGGKVEGEEKEGVGETEGKVKRHEEREPSLRASEELSEPLKIAAEIQNGKRIYEKARERIDREE
jgi:hypothetical protein